MIFTEIKDLYWHYHAIGTGVIYTYHLKAKQVITLCEYTGQIIHVKDLYNEGGFVIKEEFIIATREHYLQAIDNGMTINPDFLEQPTMVGCVSVDFGMIRN